jgi:hypothetical protein
MRPLLIWITVYFLALVAVIVLTFITAIGPMIAPALGIPLGPGIKIKLQVDLKFIIKHYQPAVWKGRIHHIVKLARNNTKPFLLYLRGNGTNNNH